MSAGQEGEGQRGVEASLAHSLLHDEAVRRELDSVVTAPWMEFWKQADDVMLELLRAARPSGRLADPSSRTREVVPAADVEAARQRLGRGFVSTMETVRLQVDEFHGELGRSLLQPAGQAAGFHAGDAQRTRELEEENAMLRQQLHRAKERWEHVRRRVQSRQQEAAAADAK
eukprot:Hpha_TRINITY_DN7955_c0_g2::TRINITY_DN7955_c0_g2_i1::g.146116::m.146116